MPNPSTIAMNEDQPPMSSEDVEILNLANEVADLQEEREALKTSLALLGQDRNAAIESRDRVLFENTAMVQQIRDLKKIAAAATRYLLAVQAFHNADVPTETEAMEAGEAEGELIVFLENQGLIPRE